MRNQETIFLNMHFGYNQNMANGDQTLLTRAQKHSILYNLLKLLKLDARDKLNMVNSELKKIGDSSQIKRMEIKIHKFKRKEKLLVEKVFFQLKIQTLEQRIDKLVFG